jgi:Fanconi anemia group M protein
MIVDSRERNQKILKHLVKSPLKFDVQKLPAGDFLVENYLIERKDVGDFLNSIRQNRFFNQLRNLKDVCKENNLNPILLIEGDLRRELFFRRWKPIQVLGVLSSVIVDFKIPVFMLANEDWTVLWIESLAKQVKGETRKSYSLRLPPPKEMSLYEKACYLLEGFENIGPVWSRKLLEKFGSIKNLVDNVFKLEKMGVPKKIAEEIRNVVLYRIGD